MSPTPAALGFEWLVTQTEDFPDRSRRLHFLLGDGRRRSVVVDQADDSPTLRAELGAGLFASRRRYNPQRSRWQPS